MQVELWQENKKALDAFIDKKKRVHPRIPLTHTSVVNILVTAHLPELLKTLDREMAMK